MWLAATTLSIPSTTVKMSYATNPTVTNALVSAAASVAAALEPKPDVIRPPPHCHRFWSATRARKFARLLLNDPKHRGTYDQNIRLVASKTHPDVDVRQFIEKVNPVLWCLKLGWSHNLVRCLIVRRDLDLLWQRVAYSSCAHCRDLADKHFFGYNFYGNNTSADTTKTCE